MAPGDKSKDNRDEDDFDFEAFLDEPGEKSKKGPPPPTDENKLPADVDDEDFASFLDEPGEKPKKGPPPPTQENQLPANLEDEDDFASFLEDSGARELPKGSDSKSIPMAEDEDDFATFLKDEEDKGATVPFPRSEDSGTEVVDTSVIEEKGGDDFDFLGEEPTRAMEVPPAFPSGKTPSSVKDVDWNATEETEIIPVASEEEDDIVIGDEEEPVEVAAASETPEKAKGGSKSRLVGILAMAGVLVAGLAGGYGASHFLVVGPLQQEKTDLEDAKNRASAAKGDFWKQLQDANGKIDELTKEKDEAVASAGTLKGEMDKLKGAAADAQKAKADAVKQLQAAAASVADLQKVKEDLAKAQAELQTAADEAAAAKEDKQKAEEKASELEAKVTELAAKPAGAPVADAKDAARVAELEKSLAEANEKIAGLNQAIERFENQVEQGTEAEKPAVAAPVAGSKDAGRAADLEKSLADANEKIASLQKEIERFEAQVEQGTEPEKPAATKTDEPPTQAVTALNEQLKKSTSDLAAANKELVAAKQQLAAAEKQLAAAKSGSTSLYLMPAEGGDQPVSLRAYHQGLQDFYLGDNQAAIRALDNAIQNYPRDARYFYYRALALRRMGEAAKAKEDAARGWALERQEHPTPYEVSQALERIQGGDRFWLSAQRSTKPAGKEKP